MDSTHFTPAGQPLPTTAANIPYSAEHGELLILQPAWRKNQERRDTVNLAWSQGPAAQVQAPSALASEAFTTHYSLPDLPTWGPISRKYRDFADRIIDGLHFEATGPDDIRMEAAAALGNLAMILDATNFRFFTPEDLSWLAEDFAPLGTNATEVHP